MARTKPTSTDPSPAEPTPAHPVRLISPYRELRVAELVRFHNGRATVDRATFEELCSRPEYGYGRDFHLDSTPGAADAA